MIRILAALAAAALSLSGLAALPAPAADGDVGTDAAFESRHVYSCREGGHLLSWEAFDRIEPLHCAGGRYVYAAERGGRLFAVDLDAASGEYRMKLMGRAE